MLGCGEEFRAPLFPSSRKVSGLSQGTSSEVRQAACRLAESSLPGWTGGSTTPSTPTFLSSPTLPFYTSFSVISWVTPPMSAWGPAPNKASNQGKVQGPQKPSQIKHREVENQNTSALPSGKPLWGAGWWGGVTRRMHSTSGSCKRSQAAALTNKLREDQG